MASLTIAITIGGIIFNLITTIFNKVFQKCANKDKAKKEPATPEKRRHDYLQ